MKCLNIDRVLFSIARVVSLSGETANWIRGQWFTRGENPDLYHPNKILRTVHELGWPKLAAPLEFNVMDN